MLQVFKGRTSFKFDVLDDTLLLENKTFNVKKTDTILKDVRPA